MVQSAGIGAHGLWSVSRGLARGLESRGDYKRMMDHADMPRQGDLDGRGNLSQRALTDFIIWFLHVCLDQVNFMTSLFELDTRARRLRAHVERSEALKPEAARLLEEALIRGEFERGEVPRITGLPDCWHRIHPRGRYRCAFPSRCWKVFSPDYSPRPSSTVPGTQKQAV